MKRWAMATVTCVVLVAVMMLAACGGGGVPGDYSYVSGDDSMKGLTLSLQDDGKFLLEGTSETMGSVSIQGDYTVEGETVTLEMMGDGGATESEPGTFKDGTLTFDEVVWQQQ